MKLCAKSDAKPPLVGAIRWDAWYDPADGRVAKDVEKSLGPSRYHFRMPFFGQVTGADSVHINGDNQLIIDKEIKLASAAGINYWAFCLYGPRDPMSIGLNLYLSSEFREDIRFCLISTLDSMDASYKENTDYITRLLAQPGYVTVLDDRPLIYLLSESDHQLQREGGLQKVGEWLQYIRNETHKQGKGQPYFVLSEGDPARAQRLSNILGIDAIGLYATVAGPFGGAPFKELVKTTEAYWDKLAMTGMAIVPNIMTGWDTRPRHENPVSWEKPQITAPKSDRYYQEGTPAEIAHHVDDALQWLATHPAAAPANTALIYAWNECDEGYGALIPNYDPQHQDGDASRLNAVAAVLRNRRTIK